MSASKLPAQILSEPSVRRHPQPASWPVERLESRRLFAAAYTVTNLFPSDPVAIPYGVSNNGHVAIGSSVGAAVYFNGVTTVLHIPGQANDVNDAGQVVGTDTTNQLKPVAFIYENGKEKKIPTLGGSISAATAINTRGDVVGYSTLASGNGRHAFLYTHATGKVTDLGLLRGGTNAIASGINDSGQIVGYADIAGGVPHGFLYSGGTLKDLGTLPGGANSEAGDINASGLIAGDGSTGGSTAVPTGLHVFTSQGGAKPKDLGAPANTKQIQATGINSGGTIVGYYNDPSFTSYAFVESAGAFKKLDTLIDPALKIKLYDAFDINDSGVIVAEGVVGTSSTVGAYMLTPVRPAVYGTVGGTVFNDLNANGKQESGEAGIAGAVITLAANGVQAAATTAASPTATTNASGKYSFTHVLEFAGYDIKIAPPAGYKQTLPTGKLTIYASPDVDFSKENFGLVKAVTPPANTASIAGTVFNDANGNGKRDSGETGLTGVTVSISAPASGGSAAVSKTLVTGSSGTYKFSGLAAGKYAVRQTIKSGYKQTLPTTGGFTVTLVKAQAVTGELFGQHPIAAIAAIASFAAPASFGTFRPASATVLDSEPAAVLSADPDWF